MLLSLVFFFFIYFPAFFPTVSAALPTCPSGTISPPGGIWSEWAITGSSKCSMTCGSCATLYYTRSCLSEKAGYPCTGETTSNILCNTHACKYPSQLTCCPPYLPMTINGSLQCGPLPRENAPNTSHCCPAGGLWTQWGTFSQNETTSKYFRRRQCASTDAGCPCDPNLGYQEQTACPCPRNLQQARNCTGGNRFEPLNITENTCTGVFQMEASNLAGQVIYCRTGVPGYDWTPGIRFWFPAIQKGVAQCTLDRPFDCQSRPQQAWGERMPVSFTCDLETLYWRYDYTGWLVTGYAQACNSGVISPPGGIWTEWVTTSSCSSTCGACSKLFYTRKCLSARAGYPCTGDATKFTACNIQTCIYPAQRTCCIPAVPMLINGSMQCGPLPKESSSTVSCCPSGGLWTQWSDFVKDASTVKYTRTRECASTEAGCPCDPKLGYEEKTECPCPKVLIAAKSCNSGSGVVPRLHRALIIDDEKCTAYLKVEASNDHYEGTKKIVYCAGVVGLNFVPALRFLAEDGTTCITDRPFDCETRPEPRTNGTLPVTFTCDLEKQLWRYDYGGWLITGYIQMSWD